MARRSAQPRPRPVSTEEFDAALIELIAGHDAAALLAVPGVYEALSEEWNNAAIALVMRNRATE